MLLSLPVELIQRVVRLSTPDEITSTTYQPRQDTLRSLCLASSLLRNIAQPILEEALRVGGETDNQQRTVQGRQQSSGRLRFLWMEAQGTVSWGNFALPTALLDFVRELRLCYVVGIDVSILSEMPALTRLSLLYVDFLEQDPPSTMRCVTELTSDNVRTADVDKSLFLSPSTFPSLQFLAYHIDIDGDYTISPSLYPQLFCIVGIDPDASLYPLLDTLPRTCQPFLDIPLPEMPIEASDLHLFVQCRIRGGSWTASSDGAESLQLLAETIASANSSGLRLSRFSLPLSLRSIVDPEGKGTVTSVEALLGAASAKGIEVVFEEGEDNLGGSLLSLSTIDYARKLRAAEERASTAGGGEEKRELSTARREEQVDSSEG